MLYVAGLGADRWVVLCCVLLISAALGGSCCVACFDPGGDRWVALLLCNVINNSLSCMTVTDSYCDESAILVRA